MENNIEKINNAVKLAHQTLNYKFSQEIPKGPNPLKLSKWYTNEIIEASNQIDLIENECSLTCSCGKGCAACCNQLIAISDVEIYAFLLTLENLDNNAKLKLRDKINEQCSILENNSLTNDVLFRAYSEDLQHALQEKYFDLNLSCPLLNTENECIIYNVRPFICWSYRFYGDKELCKTSYNLNQSIKYNELEHLVFQRYLTAKKPKSNKLKILQFALRDLTF